MAGDRSSEFVEVSWGSRRRRWHEACRIGVTLGRRGRRLALALVGVIPLGCGARTGLEVPPECFEFAGRADLAPLDLVFALDTSNSMADPTTDGLRKLDAVRLAVERFVTAPDSTGIGMTTTFFPVVRPEVPNSCFDDATCGEAGACGALLLCYPSLDGGCATDDDCNAGDRCRAMGACGGNLDRACLVDAPQCLAGQTCQPVGYCENRTRCDAEAYLASEPFHTLPDEADAVMNLLRGAEIQGSTPTLPALQGAILTAAERAAEYPGHKAIVLLATDGFPTSCDPAIPPLARHPSEGIPALCAAAAIGLAEGIQTYVVGVFAADEVGQAREQLSLVTRAGGSGEATVLTGVSDLSGQFLDSLNDVRQLGGTCAYALPRPGGRPLSAAHLTVSLGTDGEAIPLARVTRDTCDPELGGYYFDREPNGSVQPSRVELCPASCAVAQDGAEVRLAVNCD